MIGEIYEGMKVRSQDGTKLGKIDKIGDGFFVIEKGLISKERHEVKFSDIREIKDDEAIVDLTGAAAAPSMPISGRETETREARTSGRMAEARTGRTGGTRGGEIRVPLAEEELEVAKTVHEAGRVRVTKHVEVEEREIRVPVMHEEVRVERVAGSGEPATGEAFEERSFTIPVREEEVEIRKRPVVREEVRVATSAYDDEREIHEPLRREVAEVETEGEIRGAPGRDRGDKY